MIDSKLNFQNRLKIIESKLSRGVGILYRLKAALPREALCKIYFALFHPHLLYGLVAWGSTFPTYMSKLESLQNKAVKIIGGGTTRESPTPFHGQLKILKLTDLYKFEIAKLVHDFLHDKLPSSTVFSHLFKNPCIFPIALPDPVQTKTNCIFLFIALTACNVASGIRVFPFGTQYLWKYKIGIPLKSNSKNIFYNCTSDYELVHLLSHFTRAVDRLKVLKKKKQHFVFFVFLTFNNSLRIADIQGGCFDSMTDEVFS